jgi:hypothetical protein
MLLEMICIGLTLARRCQRAVFFGRPCPGRLGSQRESFVANQRGAVAFETLIVISFLMFALLLPLADLATAGFQFLSAWQALRNFGQYVQYNSPGDPTKWPNWTATLSPSVTAIDARYPMKNITPVCGVDLCSSSNVTPPRYFSYKTTVTLSPMVLGPVFNCPCSYTLSYSAPVY